MSSRIGVRVFVALVVMFLAAAIAFADSADAAFPGRNGRIAFDDAQGVKSAAADGSDVRTLAPGGVGASWSADGRWIAYYRFNRNFIPQVYRMRANGSDKQRLTGYSGGAAEPAWSPDGSQIVFQRDFPDRPSELWAMNRDGNQARRVLRVANSYAEEPAWSPNGRLIAFTLTRADGRSAIHTVRPDGTGLRRLTGFGRWMSPDWSPDGRRIVFSNTGNACTGVIRVMNRDGSNARTIYNPDVCSAVLPAWSPDGSRIVFTFWGRGSERLRTIRPDGTGLRSLPIGGLAPSWQPRP